MDQPGAAQKAAIETGKQEAIMEAIMPCCEQSRIKTHTGGGL